MKVQKAEWRKLDNASKIFPATSNNKDTKVYRLSAELYRDVDPDHLQKALDLTLESFPMYRSILRRGVFWYYLESSDMTPKVQMESENPCAPIYIQGERSFLFKVFYYKKRINIEIFHALSDGVGGMWFMETLLFHYMSIHLKDQLDGSQPEFEYGASISQKMDDSFWKNYSSNVKGKRLKKEKYKTAYKIKGKRIEENKMKVIEGAMSVEEVLTISREYGVSMTVFLTSLLMYSIYADMPKNKNDKPIVLSVPINLRGYYNSSTARNFFTTMNISYDFKNKSSEFKDIVAYVDQVFKEELTQENIHLKLARFMKLEKNPAARIVPLMIKDFFMNMVSELTNKSISSSISNVGRIQTPKEFEGYLKQCSVCVSARKPKITFASYNDRLVITFTSPYLETDIQRVFFQFLTGKDIKVEITSNM